MADNIVTEKTASVVAEGLDPVLSKYQINAWFQSTTGEPIEYRCNINSDVAVQSFTSDGITLATERPKGAPFPTGFSRFTGQVGNKKIYIKFMTTPPLIIRGAINGGPDSTQSFVGSGTWTTS